jgi:hypothetical protein
MAAAGTITQTLPPQSHFMDGRLFRIYEFSWISNADGDVKETPITVEPGAIHQVEIYPDSGATAPLDNYDLKLLNARGADLLVGGGATLDEANSRVVNVDSILHTGELLYPTIASAGDSNGGFIRILVS